MSPLPPAVRRLRLLDYWRAIEFAHRPPEREPDAELQREPLDFDRPLPELGAAGPVFAAWDEDLAALAIGGVRVLCASHLVLPEVRSRLARRPLVIVTHAVYDGPSSPAGVREWSGLKTATEYVRHYLRRENDPLVRIGIPPRGYATVADWIATVLARRRNSPRRPT